MSPIRPIPVTTQRKSLGDHVYESIRESIVTVKLEPGHMLYENELAETLGVSRTPIREAIRLLANEQLIEVLPQRGTRIALISEQKVYEVQFIREQLEAGAFRAAAKRWNPQLHQSFKDELQQLLKQQQTAALEGDLAAFFALDETFHQVIMKVTGNETLLQVVTQMRAHLNRIRYLALKRLRNMDRIIQEHAGLLEAVEGGDEELAVHRLAGHIGKLGQAISELRGVYPHYFID